MVNKENHSTHRPQTVLSSLLALLVILQFSQIWLEIGDVTVRSETVLTIVLLCFVLMPSCIHKPFGSFKTPFTWPVLIWIGMILLGIALTLIQDLSSVLKKDAFVNGIRLALAFSTFFVALQFPLPPRKKIKIILGSIVGFSFITTVVAILQIAYSDNWFHFSLPSFLVEHKMGANTAQGREVFGLNIGDTAAHSFAYFVSIQAACVFYWFFAEKHFYKKWFGMCYAILLFLIIVRISVRAATLGSIISLLGVSLVYPFQQERNKKRVLLVVFFWAILIYSGIIFLYEYAPNSYYIKRITETIPQFQNKTIKINRGSNIYGRFAYWQFAIDSFKQSPIFGNGFYSFNFTNYRPFGPSILHAHNGYLNTLSELGLVGLFALFWMLRGAQKTWLKISTYEYNDPVFIASQRILIWFLCFLLFTSMFANTLYQPQLIGSGCMILGSFADLFAKGRH